MPNRAHYMPAIAIWGVVFGLVGVIPVLNCCGCLFTLGAGVLAARQVVNAAPGPVHVSEGAIIGGITGLISGGMHGVINGLFNFLMAANLANIYRSAGMPPQLVAQAEAAAAAPMQGALTMLCAGFILGPAFGVLGGIIGAAAFKKG